MTDRDMVVRGITCCCPIHKECECGLEYRPHGLPVDDVDRPSED